MCSDWAYHVKALHGMLPTAARLLLTCPDLYHDDLCPHCLQLPETDDHLWQCAHSQVALGRIEREGTQLFWDLASEAGLGPGLSRSATIFPGPYTIVDAVRGIVPLEWVVALHTCGLGQVKARSVALKVGKYMVTAAHKEIWQPHCHAQVICEHSLLVTQKAKTSGRICVGYPHHRARLKQRVTHIACVLAGFCQLCHLSFIDHHVGVCPPLLLQAPFLAYRLLQRYHRLLCNLPSILNPRVALQALDSTGRADTGS